jgi:glycosyltransferase involved in cell wall biosynthesis
MQRRRIAYVLKSSDLGGSKRYALELCRRLDRDLFDIEMVVSPGGPLIDEMETLGITTHIVDIPRYRISARGDWAALRSLTRLFRSRRFDFVHAVNSKPGVLGRLAAHRARVPMIVFTYQQIPFHEFVPLSQRFVCRLIDRWLAHRCTSHIIAVAQHLRDKVVSQRVCDEGMIDVIHNGLEPPAPPPTEEERSDVRRRLLGCRPDRPVVAFISRLHRPKDPITFIRAAARCRCEGSNAQFVLVGDGSLAPESRALAQDLDLGESTLRFLGERGDVPDLLRGVDILVLMTQWEGLPFIILEAMGAAVPCVASDIPGNAEVIEDGRTGRLVPHRDSEALTAALLAMLADPEAMRRMGQRGYGLLGNGFGGRQMTERTTEVYERLWDRHQRGENGRHRMISR